MNFGPWRAAVAVAAFVLLAACSGGDGSNDASGGGSGRPTVDELTSVIKDGSSGLGFAPNKAECVAEVLVNSDLSDDALHRYTGQNDAEELDDADDAAFNAFLTEVQPTCDVSLGGG